MRRRHLRDRTGLRPFPSMAATAAASRPALSVSRVTELASEFRQPIANAAALVRSRRFGFYLDVLGAWFVMALFVAAAILV